MPHPRYPSLLQLNTRAALTALSQSIGRDATLDDFPDRDLDRLAAQGFDWIWLLSVWQTGTAGREVSRRDPVWRHEFQETLPDLRDEDIAGSGFAIVDYSVHAALGGDAALARLRKRLAARGLRLMLDFVPNHMGLGHRWVEEHPDYFVRDGDGMPAHGRDPNFPAWPDTLQIDYGNPAAYTAMLETLVQVASQCDGVRCDMAMLILPEIFERTWGIRMPAFWPAAIARVRDAHPGFCFMAEVYWDLEWRMQQEGFDYAYDKRLYDRLREGHARPVREHLHAGLDYQNRLTRFLENHDEPRAAAAFPRGMHEAAAVIAFLAPGLRFFHEGQFEGRTKRISPHLRRAPLEPVDDHLRAFYERLLAVLRLDVVRNGAWQLLSFAPAWEGNWTWDCFVAFTWDDGRNPPLLVAVNYAPHRSQCYVPIPSAWLAGRAWLLADRLGPERYERDGDALLSPGLYLDMAPWQAAIFEIRPASTER